METKQIIGIIIACVAVCILIGICSIIREKNEPEETETEPVSTGAVYTITTTTDFWDDLRAKQSAATETTAETGTDITAESVTSVEGTDIPAASDDTTAEETTVPDITDITAVQSEETTTTSYSDPNVDENGAYHIVIGD